MLRSISELIETETPKHSKNLSIRVTEELWRRLSLIAKRVDTKPSALIRALIARGAREAEEELASAAQPKPQGPKRAPSHQVLKAEEN